MRTCTFLNCMQDGCRGMSTPSSAVVSIRFVDGQIKFFGFVHLVTTTVKLLLKSRVDALTENEIWIKLSITCNYFLHIS